MKAKPIVEDWVSIEWWNKPLNSLEDSLRLTTHAALYTFVREGSTTLFAASLSLFQVRLPAIFLLQSLRFFSASGQIGIFSFSYFSFSFRSICFTQTLLFHFHYFGSITLLLLVNWYVYVDLFAMHMFRVIYEFVFVMFD